MRYNPDATTAPLTLESSAQPSPVINLYPPGQPPVFNPPSAYSPDGGGGAGSFYPPSSQLYSTTALDVRPRLGSTYVSPPPSAFLSGPGRQAMNPRAFSAHNYSSSTSLLGMAQGPRSTASLPIPGPHISTRELYQPATPSFRRTIDHPSTRSPSFPATLRRHPLSPTPSPSLGFTAPIRMDPNFASKTQQNIPPLTAITQLGTLQYADSADTSPVKIDITGTIDKGFFLADNEWTCYRRNYFSCVCSFSLSPHYPQGQLRFTTSNQNGTTQTYQVHSFAMCISAAVADNDAHAIELVQHTPKRDKGPIARPEKTKLNPKPPQPTHHALMYQQGDTGLGAHPRYDGGFAQQQGQYPSEHTFERIQFKQATANNGKRRAAQQYYHLIIELWADVGNGAPDPYIKVAYRKSAKMIVRGRSPGHYQSERRGSASSGPGGSAGSLGGYGAGPMMGSEFGSGGSSMMSNNYSSYDTRPTSHYGAGARHHHELPGESTISAEEAKAITETKDYQYYPAPFYENNPDPRGPIELFSHHRSEQDHAMPPMSSGVDMASKSVKPEFELPKFYPSQSYYAERPGKYQGKSSSSGYYPTAMAPPLASANMT